MKKCIAITVGFLGLFHSQLAFSGPESGTGLMSEVEQKARIQRLADRIYTETQGSRASTEMLTKVENALVSSLAYLRGEEPIGEELPLDRSTCIKFVLDKNYSPRTAKETCDALTTQSEYSCFVLVTEKNYSLRTATSACQGIKKKELACFKDILDRNYSPNSARETCVGG